MAIFHSLRVRFIVALVLVALIPIGTVAFMIDRATERAFHSYAEAQDKANAESLVQQVGALTDKPVEVLSSASGVTVSTASGAVSEGFVASGGSNAGSGFGSVKPSAGSSTLSTVDSVTSGGSGAGIGIPNTTLEPVTTVWTWGSDSLPDTSAAGSAAGNIETGTSAVADAVSISLPGVPDASFLDEVNRALLIAVGLAGVSALLLSVLLARSIVRPVEQLTSAARGMSDGNLQQRVDVRSPHEIGVLAHAFNSMADSRMQLEGLRRNLVNDVAHELRTPLANLQGYLEVLRDGLTEPTPEILGVLHEESLLLNGLVADLQELALAEAGQLPLMRAPVELHEPILNALDAIRPQAEARDLTLASNLPEMLPEVLVDTSRLSQILRNLLRNAVTHTPPGGRIDVRASTTDNQVQIAVHDTGHGIEPEHLPFIFDRFYRADPARARDTGGSGLGLAVVKNLVEAHGGTITASSTINAGSTFTFTLPIASRVLEAATV
ncbi:MAG: ATP-binding protein [Thermomicrobiales bacterium]